MKGASTRPAPQRVSNGPVSSVEWRSVKAERRANVDDPHRLRELLATTLLDSEVEEPFDRLTKLCAKLLRAPVALVSLVDDHRQFFKSSFGLDEPWASRRETPLSHSFCQHGVAANSPLVICDARRDPAFSDSLAITELGAIAYAGIPLRSANVPIGMFCALDTKPREWTTEEIETLRELGQAVESLVQLRKANGVIATHARTLDLVLQTMPAGVVVRDVDGRVLRTNAALERVLGYSHREFETMDPHALTHPDDLAQNLDASRSLFEHPDREVSDVKRLKHKDGHWVWTRRSASVMTDGAGTPQGIVTVIEDVSAERDTQEALTRQMEVYQAIARSIPRGAVFLFDHDLRFLAADGPELLANTGLDRNMIVGNTLDKIISPENYDRVLPYYRKALAGETVEIETERNGRSLLTRFAPVRDGDRILAGVALALEVTEERRQMKAVQHSKALFETTLANIHDGVALVDADWNMLLANRAFADMFGFQFDKVLEMPRSDFVAYLATLSDDPEDTARRLRELRDASGEEFVFARPRRRVLRRTATPIVLPDGPGALVIWQDITVETDLTAERDRQALTDALTGLPNRRAAELALTREQARASLAGTSLCIALFDIDHFKSINDRFGHARGDEVLRRVSSTLGTAVRATDTVARWGGEEFIAILPTTLEGAVTFCERARKAIASLIYPDANAITISVGVAQLAAREDFSSAIERADARLYEAKRMGRNQVRR